MLASRCEQSYYWPMPKRRRHQERLRNDGKLADYTPPEPQADDYGQVTEADREAFTAGARWLFDYLNVLHEHGEGSSLLQDPNNNERIHWYNHKARRSGEIVVDASCRRYTSFERGASEFVLAYYNVRVDAGFETGGKETIDLIFDAAGLVTNGSYHFFSQTYDTPRPAPDAKGDSIDALHGLGVSARGARIISAFSSNIRGASPDTGEPIPRMIPTLVGSYVSLAPEHIPQP